MKKFTFLLSIPLLTIFGLVFLLLAADESNGFKTKDGLIGINDSCAESSNYIFCAFYELPLLTNYAEAHSRDLIADNDHAQNDKGGCDYEFLSGWKYENDAQDYRLRKRYLDACRSWYAEHAVEILLGKTPTNKQVAKLVEYNRGFSIDQSKQKRFIDYMSIGGKGAIYYDALPKYCGSQGILNDSGYVSIFCNIDSTLPESTRFSKETKVFSFVTFLLAIAPLIIVIGFVYFIFNKYPPIFSSATVEWMSNKKQFRIFLVATIVWAAAFLIFSMFENDTINPFDDDDAWLPVILGLYPLLIYLITYFIVSAEDQENVGASDE